MTMMISPMRADCFFRLFNRDKARMLSPQNARHVSVTVAEDADLATILEAARAAGAPVGNHFSGIYEVQTDGGIYRRADACKIDLSTPAKAAKVTFKTWDQLEAEELAEV